jgi:hypothetical protein
MISSECPAVTVFEFQFWPCAKLCPRQLDELQPPASRRFPILAIGEFWRLSALYKFMQIQYILNVFSILRHFVLDYDGISYVYKPFNFKSYT